MLLNHVVDEAEWATARAAGVYAPAQLDQDGFLHCCTPAQLAFVLQRHFAGASSVLVLTFESNDVPAPLRWVSSEPDLDPFPHLYGPLPLAAIRRVAPPPRCPTAG